MAMVFTIKNGETVSPEMGLDYEGCVAQINYFDGAGAPVVPVGTPLLERTRGTGWTAIYPSSLNEWLVNGPVRRLRIDMTGVTGYSSYRVDIWRSTATVDMTPPGTYSGLRAATVQFYPEANIKNGLQFFLRAPWPLADPIATLTSRKLWFKTGAKPVIIKKREFEYIAEEMRISLYIGPTGVTGGTALTISNYNGVSPVAATVQALKGVTTVSDGTLIADPEYFYGANPGPARVTARALEGRERILPANTEFLVVIANTGSGDARAEYLLDGYEGGTDLPLA